MILCLEINITTVRDSLRFLVLALTSEYCIENEKVTQPLQTFLPPTTSIASHESIEPLTYTSTHYSNMSAAIGRAAGKATKAVGKAAEAGSSDKKAGMLQKGAKRDPELYVCSC